MNFHIKNKYIIYGIFILLLNFSIASSITTKTLGQHHFISNYSEGNILFSPMSSTTTYQIDYNGEIIHTWPNNNYPGYSVYPLENGNILRAARHNFKLGGMVQEIAWNGDIVWEFIYDTDEHLSHHDIEPLPNGNVLMIAWEYKTEDETIAAGRNPNLEPTGPLTPDHIIEVKPTGSTSGEIVWEWHVWDHLIQDYDPLKENYGVVMDHPELIDINFASQHSVMISDWTHVNSVDYNENLDQILLSSWYFNEIWVIDHSTTTIEAAGHTGGDSGKGGDILYRWGNPHTYDVGTAIDQKLFGQHDAQWIVEGCPGFGNILVFNNGLDRPEGIYSSIEEIIPPITQNGTYIYTPGTPFEPENPIWIYTANIPTDFYSSLISGCQRLPNGNTLICNGQKGIFFEVNPEKEIIWEYTNPYPSYLTNRVFKICYIPIEPQSGPDIEGNGDLHWKLVSPGSLQTGSFTISNIGDAYSKLNWSIIDYPNWGTWNFTPDSGQNLTPEEGLLTIYVEMIAPNQKNRLFNGEIKIVNLQDINDYDIISVSVSTPNVHQYSIQQLHNIKKLFHYVILFLL